MELEVSQRIRWLKSNAERHVETVDIELADMTVIVTMLNKLIQVNRPSIRLKNN